MSDDNPTQEAFCQRKTNQHYSRNTFGILWLLGLFAIRSAITLTASGVSRQSGQTTLHSASQVTSLSFKLCADCFVDKLKLFARLLCAVQYCSPTVGVVGYHFTYHVTYLSGISISWRKQLWTCLNISCARDRLYCFSLGDSLSNCMMHGWIFRASSLRYSRQTRNI